MRMALYLPLGVNLRTRQISTRLDKCQQCGVVPKGLLTFFGSFYKEVAKTTPGTLVYRFERQTARKKIFLPSQKHCVLNVECRILSQEPSDSFILYFKVIIHGQQAEKDTNRPLVTSEYCENMVSLIFRDGRPSY